MSILDLSGYKLTFAEEFNAFSWSPDGRAGTTWKTTYQGLTRTLSNNGEQEYYSDATVGVDPFKLVDGALQIEAKPSSGNPLGMPYTSGVITTENSFAQQYGYFEMRAQLPEGQGLWPAFWLLAADKHWPPELDPLEGFGSKPNSVHTGVISSDGSQNFGDWHLVPADVTTGYHTYGLAWTATELVFYFDGEEIARGATPTDMHQPMYLLANLAVGGNWPGVPDASTQFPAHMNIDYIHAYSNDPNSVAIAQPTISTPDADWVTAAAAPHSSAPVVGGAPTTTASGNTGTAGNDLFNDVYGDTATRYGGAGDDTYVVADDRLHIVEKPGEGIDNLKLWIDYRLPDNVENAQVDCSWGVSVNGNTLSNIIKGGAGEDVINGRGGDDLLSGGGGKDIFIVSAGNGYDTIADFTPGTDQLVLDGYAFRNFAAVQAAMTTVGSDTVLTLDNGETVTFQGVDKSAFTSTDFRFTSVTKAAPAPAPMPAPTPSGADVLKLCLAEDAYKGDAQFKVLVDGKQIGGTQTATASHGAGASQVVTLNGDFGSGSHKVEIVFTNDLYGGSAAADRNLYINWIELNGNRVEAETGGAITSGRGATTAQDVVLWTNGTLAFNGVAGGSPTPAPGPTPLPTPAPTPSGQSTIKLHVSEDWWQGDAQFKLFVDGKQAGANYTVAARHGAGAWQDIEVSGDFGAVGPQKVEVKFVNDAWGGTAATDRNMYVDWIEVNGHRFEGEKASFNSASLKTSATEAIMESNGTLVFDTKGSPPIVEPVIADPAAHATPDLARSYVGTDASGIAHGSTAAENIYASGNGQTLIGGGGDDVFHVGSYTNLAIVVPDAGVTTVSTWATKYTLADGVDNLTLQGNYSHNATGNALANTIVGADGNDVLNGGAGGDTIIVGSGANKLTGGSGQDLFVFRSGAAHDNIVTDFHLGEDMLDLKAAVAATGYKGTDAVADHVLTIAQAGADAVISIDPDGTGAQAAHKVVTLQNVAASSLHAGHDFLWH